MIASNVKNAFASAKTSTTAIASNAITSTTAIASTAITSTTAIASTALTSTTAIASTALTSTTAIASTITSSTALVTNTLSSTLKVQHHLRIRLRRQRAKSAWASRLTAPMLEIELNIACQKLPKKNSFTNANGFCVLTDLPSGTTKQNRSKKPPSLPGKLENEIGRTEVVRETNDPIFSTKFRLEYKFQEEQTYVVRIYDEDLRYATDLKEHDYVGGAIFTLGEVLGSNSATLCRFLGNGKAFVIVSAEEIDVNRDVLEFRLSCQDLINVEGVMDISDPYFQLEKLRDVDKSWEVVWKSEVLQSTSSPTWNTARLPVQLLCHGDLKNFIKISLWDYKHSGTHAPLGFVETTVEELCSEAKNGIPVFHVLKEKKRLLGGTKMKKSGYMKVLRASVTSISSMYEFLKGGCELSLMIAVDCTSKNGAIHTESSLHHRSMEVQNDYQSVISKLGSIMEHYGTSRKFGMWGFGGRIKGEDRDYFQMGETEEVKGVKGLLAAYNHCMDNLSFDLGDTTKLNPVIEAAMYRAIQQGSGSQQCYSVLCILAASEISDVQDTINVICTAAEDAPLSVIIIGIGGEKFSSLERLAGDSSGTLHDSRGVPIARDVLHFASLNQFSGNASNLAAEVLRDIPEHVVQYFTNNGVKPNPPVKPRLEPAKKKRVAVKPTPAKILKRIPKKSASQRSFTDGAMTHTKKKKKKTGLKRRASESNISKIMMTQKWDAFP